MDKPHSTSVRGLGEIALRVASDRRRKHKRMMEDTGTEIVALMPSAEASPYRAAKANEALSRVQTALETLSPEKRAVFVLFELEGESCDIIAQGLGIPVGTVYSRLHAARREFARTHHALRPPDPSASDTFALVSS